MKEINYFFVLLNIIPVLVFAAFGFAICIKLTRIAFAILAYPIYLALYGLEFVVSKIITLTIPEQSEEKHKLNAIAGLALIFMTPNLFNLYIIFSGNSVINPLTIFPLIAHPSSIMSFSNGVALLLVMAVYFVSSKYPSDTRSPMEKISSLSVPSLWKDIVKE
jgi:hypothetical protein